MDEMLVKPIALVATAFVGVAASVIVSIFAWDAGIANGAYILILVVCIAAMVAIGVVKTKD